MPPMQWASMESKIQSCNSFIRFHLATLQLKDGDVGKIYIVNQELKGDNAGVSLKVSL